MKKQILALGFLTSILLIFSSFRPNTKQRNADFKMLIERHNSKPTETALAVITDPANSSLRYEIYGSGGYINTFTNVATGLTDPGKSVSGSYTASPGNPYLFHCTGNFFRGDGTFFSFNVTQDIY